MIQLTASCVNIEAAVRSVPARRVALAVHRVPQTLSRLTALCVPSAGTRPWETCTGLGNVAATVADEAAEGIALADTVVPRAAGAGVAETAAALVARSHT